MRYFVLVAVAAVVGAVVWFRPSPTASVAQAGWQSPGPLPRGTARPSLAPTALVYVAGAVARPGVYTVAAHARVRDAVALAGGIRSDGDPVAVNLASHLRDGDEIVVPQRGAVAAPGHGSGRVSAAGHRGAHKRHARAAPPSEPLDLNTADATALAAIPGVGAGLAERIVAFRASNGRFDSPDQLLDVAGITDRRLETMLPYVVVR